MQSVPEDLFYSHTHEWVRIIDENTAVVGITDHAQHLLGDIVYVELPDLEAEVSETDELGVIESVKTAADFYAPLSGKIIEINEDVTEAPSLVNKDPYGDGWLFKIEYNDEGELKHLLNAESYAEQVAEEE